LISKRPTQHPKALLLFRKYGICYLRLNCSFSRETSISRRFFEKNTHSILIKIPPPSRVNFSLTCDVGDHIRHVHSLLQEDTNMAAKKSAKKSAAKKPVAKKTKTVKKAAGKTAKKTAKKSAKKRTSAKKSSKKPASKAAKKPAKKAAPAAKVGPSAAKKLMKKAPPAGVPSMLGGLASSRRGMDDGEE
jgi:hypothetical protein